jgi:hypothetical protein
MTLERINPEDLPTPETYTRSSSRVAAGWCSSVSVFKVSGKMFGLSILDQERPRFKWRRRPRRHLEGRHAASKLTRLRKKSRQLSGRTPSSAARRMLSTSLRSRAYSRATSLTPK